MRYNFENKITSLENNENFISYTSRSDSFRARKCLLKWRVLIGQIWWRTPPDRTPKAAEGHWMTQAPQSVKKVGLEKQGGGLGGTEESYHLTSLWLTPEILYRFRHINGRLHLLLKGLLDWFSRNWSDFSMITGILLFRAKRTTERWSTGGGW